MGAPESLDARIAAIGRDRESGASELLAEVVAILRRARETDASVLAVARALVRAQPSMAPVWNAAVLALVQDGSVDRLERFAERAARAPAAIARVFTEFLEDDAPHRAAPRPLRLVTLSFSGTLLTVLDRVRTARAVQVACTESRPALEGRRLAVRLSEMGVAVTFFTDAAIGHALRDADAVVVGADAVAPAWVMNKSGTRLLAAAAHLTGVPVYVLASRDKFASAALAARLASREGDPREVWENAAERVTVRNPYFERTPLDLVTAVISDTGVLDATLVPDACAATAAPSALAALDALL